MGPLNRMVHPNTGYLQRRSGGRPVMSRTHPNREYLIAGTSQGYVYPIGTDAQDQALLTAKTIFE